MPYKPFSCLSKKDFLDSLLEDDMFSFFIFLFFAYKQKFSL